jgi:hypothetical protein
MEQPERRQRHGDGPDPGAEAIAAFEKLFHRVVLETWQLRLRSPEVRRAMGDLYERVEDVARLRDSHGPEWAHTRVRELGLITRKELMSIESTYSRYNALSAVVLTFGGPEYRAIRRAGDVLRPAGRLKAENWPPSNEALLAKAKELGAAPGPELENEALLFREQEYTRMVLHAEARRRTRARLLFLLVPFMLGLVMAFAWLLADAAQSGAGSGTRVALAAVAGALGATLSGLFRVRDLLTGLSEVRAFRAVIFVQPLVGAAFGLFLAAILSAGIAGIQLPSGEDQAATLAVFGFLAGFSEPFALGIVQRAAGAAESQTNPETAASGAPPSSP